VVAIVLWRDRGARKIVVEDGDQFDVVNVGFIAADGAGDLAVAFEAVGGEAFLDGEGFFLCECEVHFEKG